VVHHFSFRHDMIHVAPGLVCNSDLGTACREAGRNLPVAGMPNNEIGNGAPNIQYN